MTEYTLEYTRKDIDTAISNSKTYKDEKALLLMQADLDAAHDALVLAQPKIASRYHGGAPAYEAVRVAITRLARWR